MISNKCNHKIIAYVITILLVVLTVQNVQALTKSIRFEANNGSDWHLYAVESGGFDYYSSLCLDSENLPHLVGSKWNDYYLTYANWHKKDWVIDDYACGFGEKYTVSMALDDNNIPHIAFCTRFEGMYILKYSTLVDDEWVLQLVDCGAEGFGLDNSIAIDAMNRIHIAYATDYESADIKYAFYDGNEWTTETVYAGESEEFVAFESDIAVDSNNCPHIAYKTYDKTDWDTTLCYAKKNGNSWEKEIVDDSNKAGYYLSIDVDKSNNPHISYVERSDGTDYVKIKYAYKENNNWNIENLMTGKNQDGMTSIKVDSNDNPHIAICKQVDQYESELIYMKKNGASWESEVVYSGKPKYPCLQLDEDNNPHIGFCDQSSYTLYYVSTVKIDKSLMSRTSLQKLFDFFPILRNFVKSRCSK